MPEHAIISTLQDCLLGPRAGFALVGCPHRIVTADGVVLVDLLFFHIPTDRYVAILVDNEGPMDYLVDQVRHRAALLDDSRRRAHSDAVGIAILATESGVIIRYSYPNAIDAAEAEMPSVCQLTAAVSGAVGLQPDMT